MEFSIGPLFIENATSKGLVDTTVASSSYNVILQNHLISALKDGSSLNTAVLMQKTNPPNIIAPVKLCQTFREDNIRCGNFSNPLTSLSYDLSLCNLYLSGYTKYCVYKENMILLLK